MSKYTDGKVLRSTDTVLTLPELMILRNNLENMGHSATDLRTLDGIADKISDALEGCAFYTEYTDAVNGVDMEIAEKNITNDTAIAFLREQAIRPIARKYTNDLAPDVFLAISDWSWIKRRWNERTNFGGEAENRRRVLRITDAIEHALGYKNMPDKTVAVEGDEKPDLRVVGE